MGKDTVIVCSVMGFLLVFAGLSIYQGITPYLAMLDGLNVDIHQMFLVDREYPFSSENRISDNRTSIKMNYPIQDLSAIYLQNDTGKTKNYLHPNTLINDRYIDLSNNPLDFQLPKDSHGGTNIPVVVDYYHHNWTSVTWVLDLKVNNTSTNKMRIPKANITLGNMGTGWIANSTDIPAQSVGIARGFLKVYNNRYWHDFLGAILSEQPIALSADLEAYAFIDFAWIKIPFMGLKIPLSLDFPIGGGGSASGDPPKIIQTNRTAILPNQPVGFSVLASDKGAGISNRTYVRYSVDNGLSWINSTLAGPAWVNQTDEGDGLGGYYPWNSSASPQLYVGSIPGFAAGKYIKYKIYMEDYAGNVDHIKPGNNVETEVRDYTVPTTGQIDPEIGPIAAQSKGTGSGPQSAQEDDRDFGTRVFDYIQANGVDLMYFLKKQGITLQDIIDERLDDIVFYLYEHDVDANFFVGSMLNSFDAALDLIADSGLNIGNLIDALDVDIPQFFKFAVDHIMMPPVGEFKDYGKAEYNKIHVVDTIDTNITTRWIASELGDQVAASISNPLQIYSDVIGNASLNWTTNGISASNKVECDFGATHTVALAANDMITFNLDYDPLMGTVSNNIKMVLTDKSGASATSSLITVPTTLNLLGDWNEIALACNTSSFSQDINWAEIKKVGFMYTGISVANIFVDFIAAYDIRNYLQYIWFTNGIKITNSHIDYVQNKEFTDIAEFSIVPGVIDGNGSRLCDDWDIQSNVTSYINFLNLVATESGTFDASVDTNQHVVCSFLILKYAGVPGAFNRLVSLVNATMYEGHKVPPVDDIVFWSYMNNFILFLLGVPLIHNLLRILMPRASKKGKRN